MPQRFVYYRVRQEHVPRAEAVARTMQSEFTARWPGLQARLLRRADVLDVAADVATLMEIYEGLPSREAAAEIERQATVRLQAWMQGPRHVEDFEPCA